MSTYFRKHKKTLIITLMVLPGALWFLVLRYIPMVGVIMAFQNYRPYRPNPTFWNNLINSEFVGFANFEFIFFGDRAWNMIRNTLAYNAVFIVLTTVLALALAVGLNEIGKRFFAKLYQTLMFFPFFISWVVASYFVFAFLDPTFGVLSDVRNWYMDPAGWPVILTTSHLWKSLVGESLRQVGYTFFPIEWTLHSFQAAFELGDQLWRSFFNSILVTVVGTVLGVLFTVLYSYALFRKDYPLRKFFTFFALFTMIFSGGLVPFVIVMRQLLGVDNTYWALILPLMMSPFHIIIMRTFFKTSIPDSLIDAASIDGSGEFRTLFQIVVPLAKPGIATVALLTAIAYWNDWWNAMLFIRDRSLFPLQYLLQEMQQNIEFLRGNMALIGQHHIALADLPSQGLRMALAVIIVLPIALAYPFFQRYIISGLTIGAVKE